MNDTTSTTTRVRFALSGVLSCALVAGCLGSPRSTIAFLTLPRVMEAPAPAAPNASGELLDLSVGLGPFSVAPHLDRRSLAYRVDGSRVEFADSAQWAAPLEDMVAEYISARMAETTGGGSLDLFPWTMSQAPEVQLVLHVEEFAIGPGNDATVAARWSLREPRTGRHLDGGSWEQTLPVAGVSASQQVQVLSSGLDALSAFLSEQLRNQVNR